MPIHFLGTALRVLRYESKLSKTGWLYEAWIITPETRARSRTSASSRTLPRASRSAPNVSERVVFNGYFLKIMKYQAGDVARGAPVLVGRIGWEPHEAPVPIDKGMSATLRWTLIGLALMFVISMARWAFQLRRLFTRPEINFDTAKPSANDDLDPAALSHWVQSVARDDLGPQTPEP